MWFVAVLVALDSAGGAGGSWAPCGIGGAWGPSGLAIIPL